MRNPDDPHAETLGENIPSDPTVLALRGDARRIAANIAKLLTLSKRRNVAKATNRAGHLLIEFHRAWPTCVRNGLIERPVIPHMETSTQYREFAEQCERLADHAKTERHRSVLKEMAETWKELANEAET